MACWLPRIRIDGGTRFEGDASRGFGIDRVRIEGAREAVAADIRTLVLQSLLVKRVEGSASYFEFEVAGRIRIWCVENGFGEGDDGRRVFPIRRGRGAVAARNVTRTRTESGGAGWMVDIDEETLRTVAERATGRVIPPTLDVARPLDPAGSLRFMQAMQTFERVFSPATPSAARARGLREAEGKVLDAMIAGPLRHALEPFMPDRSRICPRSTVGRAIDLITARFAEPLTLAEIAAAAGVGARALQIAFRRHLGCSPLAYLRTVRLAEARRLLARALVPTVTDAAMQAGFWHLGEFSVAYRQQYGESPSATLSGSPDSQFR